MPSALSDNRVRRAHQVLIGAGAAVLLLALTACGGSESPDDVIGSVPQLDDGCMTVESGEASGAVKVTGKFGGEPEVTFETPLTSVGTQRTVLDEGDGERTAKGQVIESMITVVSGADGTSLGTQPATFKVGDAQILPAFASTIDCVPIGSRVVATAAVADLYGPDGNEDLGLAGDDSVVIVTDVMGKVEMPTPSSWTEDVPEVTFDDEGVPTLTLPKTDPPQDLLLKVLAEGDGPEVADGDNVTLHYQGTSWNTGEIFDQSYGRQVAVLGTGDVVSGFGAALVGQKVGSRLVVTIPPRFAYGEDEAAGDLGGQTLVFVIEIQETATP